MFEKVNPSHPDKLADRIAGAMVDMAYREQENPKVAVEVLLGHGACHVICESSVTFDWLEVKNAVARITRDGDVSLDLVQVQQDEHLAANQDGRVRCGDNGIFKGCPTADEQRWLSTMMRKMYEFYPYDGKAVMDHGRLILCQSNVSDYDDLIPYISGCEDFLINPLGPWTGGIDVDTGATNRKLGSDMGDAVTGGGLHGKDLSKADVSVNIACHLLAQAHGQVCTASCAIGDDEVTFRFEDEDMTITEPYEQVVEMARDYVRERGGFERLAEWGLV